MDGNRNAAAEAARRLLGVSGTTFHCYRCVYAFFRHIHKPGPPPWPSGWWCYIHNCLLQCDMCVWPRIPRHVRYSTSCSASNQLPRPPGGVLSATVAESGPLRQGISQYFLVMSFLIIFASVSDQNRQVTSNPERSAAPGTIVTTSRRALHIASRLCLVTVLTVSPDVSPARTNASAHAQLSPSTELVVARWA